MIEVRFAVITGEGLNMEMTTAGTCGIHLCMFYEGR